VSIVFACIMKLVTEPVDIPALVEKRSLWPRVAMFVATRGYIGNVGNVGCLDRCGAAWLCSADFRYWFI